MARRRNEGAAQAPAEPGTSACPLCGEVVPVGEDGRCDLGHRVRQPGTDVTEPLSHVDVIDRGGEVPAAAVAGPAAAGLAAADTMRLDHPEDEPVDMEPVDPDDAAESEPAQTDETDETDPAADGKAAQGGDVDLSGELDW